MTIGRKRFLAKRKNPLSSIEIFTYCAKEILDIAEKLMSFLKKPIAPNKN